MATGAGIIEPAAPSMEHASGILDQIVTEFSLGELKKPHVEMHLPLQAIESTEELAITNGCKAEESVRVEYEGNGRALEGESFSESPPSAKVAAEQNEAGEARCEEAVETSMHEKQPLGDVTVGEEHGHKTDEAEVEAIKEEKTYQETSTEECAPIIEKEVSTLEKSSAEIESEKFDVEYIERDLGEMKYGKPSEAGPECKSEDTDVVSSGLSLVNRSEVGLHPEEATDSISVSTAVIDSVVIGEDEQGLTGQSKSVTENPEDCVPVAAEATVITEEETPSLSQVDGFRQEEAREDKDELDLALIQEEKPVTSQPVEMETEELHKVSSCKPEEQVTEKDEPPLLTETPTGDAHEASKSAEIPFSIHSPAEEKLTMVEEAGQLQCEAGGTEIPKEQVHEAFSTTETMAEVETKAIKDAEDAIDKDHSLEQGILLTGGEKSADIVIEEDASVLKETQAEDESKADRSSDDVVVGCPSEEKNSLLIDEAEPLDNGVNDTEAVKLNEIPRTGRKEEITEENEAPMSREVQAEDISEASESKEIAIPEQPSTDREDLPLDQEDVETEELKTGSVDMEVEKRDEISDFESKEEGNGELEAPLAREIQAEEESETNASEASAGPVTGTDTTDCLKEAEEEQPGVEIGHDTEAPSASLEDSHSAEEVAPAADENEAEITEPKEDNGDVVAFKDEDTEASVVFAEEHGVASSSENAEPGSSKDTSEEANDEPLKCEPENSVTMLVGENDIKEVKSGDEEPNANDSTSKEAAPIEDEVGTEVKEPEIENHARSIDTPLQEIDTKEDDTSNLDKVEGDTHEEVTCDELSTEIPENSPMLPPEEIIEADMGVAEAPEDNRKIEKILLQEEEKLTNENEQTEGGEDMTAEKQSEEKVHNPEDEILMRNETEDMPDQSTMDEPKVSDECSPNQNMQAEEIEKAEPLPVSSLLEKAILEESMASSENPVEELGEVHEPMNIKNDSKPDVRVIEEHEEPEKATEDEKEVKVQPDINLESSLDSEVGDEKCVEEEEVQTTQGVVGTQEANLRSHEEKIETETQEKDSETTREVVSETEAPEISTGFKDTDEQATCEEVTTSLEPEKQCEKITEENDSTEEKVTSEEVRDAEILMRDASVDVTDQGKVDELKETDESSANQNIQMDDGGCEKTDDEALNNAEPLPASSETEKVILAESTTYKNLDGELGEDDKPENVPIDSKTVFNVVEEVNDSADAEISSASEPASEDQSNEVLPDQGLSADDVNEFRDQVCIPAVVGGVEVKETIKSVSETARPESVDGTMDAVESTEERHDIEKADENDKEVKVQDDVNTESLLATEVREEKCSEEEDVPTSGAPEPEVEVSESVALIAPVEDEANDQSNKETGKPETEVIDIETAREVVSETEVTELPAEFEDANKQTTFEIGHDTEAPSASLEDSHSAEEVAPAADEKEAEITEPKEDKGDEAPEDNRKIDEILWQEEEKLTNENEQTEGGEDMTAKKQSEEKVHNPEDEILMRNETEDMPNQSTMDEPKVSDECSPNQNMQAEEIEKAEPLPVSSLLEKAILEESMVSSENPVEELGEVHEPVNIEVDSKPDVCIIEEVIDSADTVKEISYASAPSSEDHGYEAISGTEHDTLQEPNESPTVDVADKIMDRECTPNEISETHRHETVNDTTDATEVIDEHEEPEKATEDEKEVKVQPDINLEPSLDSEVGDEKCVEEEEVQTTQGVVGTQEENLRSREETIETETQEKDSETTREVVSETEAPEISTGFKDTDEQATCEEVTTSLEPEKQCEKITEENDSTEEKVTSEEVRDAEILMRDASVDVTDQGKVDELKETDESYANQNIQMDDGGCEKTDDEALNNAEPLPASSETEKVILAESTTYKNLDGELGEDDKPENVPIDSKTVFDVVEEVNDSADAEISSASEPASDDQSNEVLPDQGLSADDVNEFRDQVCIPAVVGGVEVKEMIESVSETERPESVDGTMDAVESTEERNDIEKADENDKEVKVQDDVNTESLLATEVREEKCSEEEDVPTSGAPEPEVEVSERVALIAPVEDEANDQSNKQTGKPETEVIDIETAREVVSGTEVTELPAEFEDANKQTTFEEATGSSEPEKQCEKATGADDPVEEKASTGEVDDGEVKTREIESLEEREIDEVGYSKEIHATSPVEYATIKEEDSGPVLEGTEAELENVHPEEIIAGGSECETKTEDLEKEKDQEGRSGSILESEDATEEASSNPTSQQCIPEQETAKKEAAVQDPDDEQAGSKVAPEEACGSKHPETEAVDAVDGTFEEEKSEETGITGETDVISREMDMSDSQCTESVSVEETSSDQPRELETQVLAPIPDVILGGKETAAIVEETAEENEKGVELQKSDADEELPCAAEVTGFQEKQRTVDGDSEANEADTKEAIQVEDLGHEPLMEETKTAHIDALIGEESIATADATGLSLEKAATTQEPNTGSQVEETAVSEDSKSPNSNVVEATMDAGKPCENIVETSNDKEHHGVGDVDESASMKQVIDKDDAPEERDFSTVPTDYDEAAVKVELTGEENEEVLTDVNELSTKEEQAIPEAQDPDNENEGSKVVAEEACGSKHPETEVVDAVDGTFEEEEKAPAGITGETDGISRETDVSDSQCTESASMEETNSHQSRELETQVLAAVSGENENAAMVEKTTEDDKTGVEVQQNEDLDLASAAEVAKSEEQQRTVDGDSEANADTKEATKVEDFGQEPLKEETETAHIDALIGDEVAATTNATYLSLEKAATTQEPRPGTQTEEIVVSEVSQSPNVNVVEATIDANKQCENIVETSNDEEHHGVGDVDGSESVKQVNDKDDAPEERDFGIGSADYDEVAVKVELTSEENEEVLTDTKEFPTTEEQAILEAHCEQKAVSLEQPGTMFVVTEEESLKDVLVQETESRELSSASEMAKDECIEKDKQIEDVASAANESSETRSLIFEEGTVEASKEYKNAVEADGIIQDDIPNEKDDIGHGKAHEGESSEDVKPTCEISSESLVVGEEGDSGIIPGEGISEIEASASSVLAADADTDDGQILVSAAVADDVEEHVEEKVAEIAKKSYDESNDAATLTTEETVVKSLEAEKDEPVKESDRDILTDNALEADDIERGGILVEEAHNPHGEAEESTDIKEEEAEKACITEEIHAAYEERDSITAPSVDIAAKDLIEQIQVGNIEPDANATSAGDSTITDVLESDATVDEQVSTSVEEMKEVKEDEKEIPEEAEDRCEKIDREVPEISLSEAEQDQKPVEKTAETEIGHGREEPPQVLTTVCPSTEELGGTKKASGPTNGSIDHAEATAVVEEVTVKNTDVGGRELESGEVAEKISMETAEFASVPEEMEETVKEVELRHDENLQSAPAPEAAEEACLEKAEEISTEATESASVMEEVKETTKEVELRHGDNPQSAPDPEAVEEICLEKAEEISTEASVAEEIEQTTKEAELQHDENLQPASAPVPAEEVCSEKAEEVITKTAASISVTEEIEETTKEVDLRHEENLQSALAPESAEEACSEKVEEVTTNTAESVSIREDIEETAKEVELRHDQNVEPAFTLEATDEVCSGKAEETSLRAAESSSVTEEIEETTKEVELRHDNNLQSAPAPEPAREVCSENAEEISAMAAESLSDIETHKVSNQLEDAEIIEKHFEVATANSVAEEPTKKIADEISPGIASAEKPVYPFVEELESRQPEEIHKENRLKDDEVIEEKMETLTSAVNELRDQEEKIFKVEDEPAHKEVGDINGEIMQEEKVSTAISEGECPSERSLCKTMETVIPTGKDDGATIEKPEESILGPETPHLPEHGTAEVVCTPGRKTLEELAMADAADVPLSDLLKKPATETLQATTRAVETSDAVESSLAETNKTEEAKTDEERDEHEDSDDEHRRPSPEHDTPVMVESSKDIDVKTPQKKSHNILSGVGSKVKHSISKVKKAITGKSSHSKTASPPKQSP